MKNTQELQRRKMAYFLFFASPSIGSVIDKMGSGTLALTCFKENVTNEFFLCIELEKNEVNEYM